MSRLTTQGYRDAMEILQRAAELGGTVRESILYLAGANEAPFAYGTIRVECPIEDAIDEVTRMMMIVIATNGYLTAGVRLDGEVWIDVAVSGPPEAITVPAQSPPHAVEGSVA